MRRLLTLSALALLLLAGCAPLTPAEAPAGSGPTAVASPAASEAGAAIETETPAPVPLSTPAPAGVATLTEPLTVTIPGPISPEHSIVGPAGGETINGDKTGSTDHEGTDHEGMDHEGMDHEGMDHEGMDHEGMDHEGMDHEGMDHEGMDHEGMDHEGMDHEGMDHEGTDDESTDHESTDHSSHAADPAQPFDAAFLDDMILHHEGAVAMAQELLQNTQRPELVEMAGAIIAAQAAEIAQMEAWRAAWYPGVAVGQSTGMAMGDMEVSGDTSLPYEQRFLVAMIAHHAGAIGMAQAALEQAEHPEVRELATAIIAAQESEIAQMQAWLAEWFGQ